MNTHRIEILYRADNNAVITPVPHHFHLKLFPTENAFLNEQFVGGRRIQPTAAYRLILLSVVGNSTAAASKGEGGSDNDGKANPLQDGCGLFH